MQRICATCIAAAIIAFGPVTAKAECSLSELRQFNETLNPSLVPKLPDNASCPTGLERYRIELELYRKNKIEIYNRKLIAFGKALKIADDNFRRAASSGVCSAAEYETFRTKAAAEFEKIGSDYKDPYDQNMDAYSAYIDQYRKEAFRCMISSSIEQIRVAAFDDGRH